MGPFEVTARQIRNLDAAYTPFVNALLAAEVSAAELKHERLEITDIENRGDGGVDAHIAGAPETAWIPIGDSAWQFKRGDLGPADCEDELRGATRALDVLRNGGAYRLVLGAALNHDLRESRRNALIKAAREAGVLASDEQIRVLDANHIAEWASDYPAIAVGRLLGHPSPGAFDFATWTQSNRHATEWVETEGALAVIEGLRRDISDPAKRDIRIQGASGLGKTRAALEACRGQEWENLVAYVADERDASADLNRLVANRRTAVLIVDECPSRRHEKLAELLPTESSVTLLTVGEPDGYVPLAPIYEVEPAPTPHIETFLEMNYPALWPEARRVIAANCNGNFRQARVLSDRLLSTDRRVAAELVERNDQSELLRVLVPGDEAFLVASAFALFERVGFERELAYQAGVVADFLNMPLARLQRALERIDQAGVLDRQGRYRTVAPHPFAVLLAAEAWRVDAHRIIGELLPACDREMTLSLLGRAADLGSYEPARTQLQALIDPTGPFGSLQSIEENALGDFLLRLCVVAPRETLDLLAPLIQAASLEDLRSLRESRRALVWALGKLAWHSEHFARAADALLKLALAENETYSNNATGSWNHLFGAGLPTTAAQPSVRLAYLREKASQVDSDIRLQVVAACRRNLPFQETVSVEPELQRGQVVEPRGSVRTLAEARQYKLDLVAILTTIYEGGGRPGDAAAEALVDALRYMADDPVVGRGLVDSLARLRNEPMHRLRIELEHIKTMVDRGRRSTDLDLLRELESALPAESDAERLETLLNVEPWEMEEDAHTRELVDLIRRIGIDDAGQGLQRTLARPIKAGARLGQAIAQLEGNQSLFQIADQAAAANPEVIAAILRASVEQGGEAAFDEYLEGDAGARLPDTIQLWLTRLGPQTDSALQRLIRLASAIPVAEGVRALGWMTDLAPDMALALAESWRARIATQDDYNALVDWFGGWTHAGNAIDEPLADVLFEVVEGRRAYPEVRNERWDWARLAERFIPNRSIELVELVLDLIESHELVILDSDEEARLLVACLAINPRRAWDTIATALTGSWRIALTIRGWLTPQVPLAVLESWVADDLNRARLLASVAHAGGNEPSAEARMLFERFGSDPDIEASLAGDFVSGVWMGPASQHTGSQIQRLRAWDTPANPEAMRLWARRLADGLTLEQVREREAEEEEGR